MDVLMMIMMVILMWMFASGCFMLVYRVTGEETKVEQFLLYLFAFPWLVSFVIAKLISAFIGICEKKNKENKNK